MNSAAGQRAPYYFCVAVYVPVYAMCLEKWVWGGAPKKEWGPRGWRWLHVAAINYPAAPTMPEARLMFRRIWNFLAHLPCEDCQAHALQFAIRWPPDLAGPDTLQRWAHDFHNSVNRRLGKPSLRYEDYLEMYAAEILWAGGSTSGGRGASTR